MSELYRLVEATVAEQKVVISYISISWKEARDSSQLPSVNRAECLSLQSKVSLD